MITASHDPDPGASLWHIRLTVALLLAVLLALLWATGHGPGAAGSCCAGSSVASTATSAALAPAAVTAAQPVPAVESPPEPAVVPAAPVAAPTQPPVATPEAVAIVDEAPMPTEPGYSIDDPNAEVRATASTLEKWTGPSRPKLEHEVQIPAPRPVVEPAEGVAEAAPVEEPAAEPPAEPPAEPAYTLTDPNAQVRSNQVELSPWTGPTWPKLDHFVYYPPAKAVAAEPLPTEPAPAAEPSPAPEPAADLPPAEKVYFATSKWDLPADTSGKLAPIIAYLQSHPTAKAVIQGFHDPRGDAETNAMLAKNRAGAIWNVLTEAGISRDRVILQKPLDTTGTGSLAEARRAEVSVRNE